MARRAVVDIDLGFKDIVKSIANQQGKTVLIGFQETAKTRYQTKGDRTQKAGESVAGYAAKNEFGTDKIPQRSFLRSTMIKESRRINIFINKTFEKLTKMRLNFALLLAFLMGLMFVSGTQSAVQKNLLAQAEAKVETMSKAEI